jgi:hypothetical protein
MSSISLLIHALGLTEKKTSSNEFFRDVKIQTYYIICINGMEKKQNSLVSRENIMKLDISRKKHVISQNTLCAYIVLAIAANVQFRQVLYPTMANQNL